MSYATETVLWETKLGISTTDLSPVISPVETRGGGFQSENRNRGGSKGGQEGHGPPVRGLSTRPPY